MNKKSYYKATLSVVIVNYNSMEYCIECLNSLLESENVSFGGNPDIKISDGADCDYYADVVVVDNFSKDDSVNLIRKYHPWVTLIALEQNTGYSRANNIGASLLNDCDYLLLLNPDTTLEPATLAGMLSYLGSKTSIGLTTCYLEMKMTGSIDWACHRGLPTPWASFCYFSGLANVFEKSRLFGGYHLKWKNFNTEHEIFSPVGAFFLLPRNIYHLVGGLDEKYFLYGEDIDLAYKIKAQGYRVTFNPDYKAYHYKGMSSNIKKHSRKRVDHSYHDRIRAYDAFYDSMITFYKKFLVSRYPFFINWLVISGIELKRRSGKKALHV